MVLDTNNDGSFADETPQPGFGMHADAYITFDLAVIRAENGLPADQPLRLTGELGIANFRPGQQFGNNTDTATILVDGEVMRLYDFEDSPTKYHQFETTSFTIPGTARYLSFAGLVGKDILNSGSHLGFTNMNLTPVPEPSTVLLVAIGVAMAPVVRRRRK